VVPWYLTVSTVRDGSTVTAQVVGEATVCRSCGDGNAEPAATQLTRPVVLLTLAAAVCSKTRSRSCWWHQPGQPWRLADRSRPPV